MPTPKRVRVEIGFELDRHLLLSKAELDRVFEAALLAILKVGEHYYRGRLGTKFVTHRPVDGVIRRPTKRKAAS